LWSSADNHNLTVAVPATGPVDLKTIVILALQVSILSTVFGFGLKATSEDLLYVVRRPGLLARSLLAVFLIMPVIALVLVGIFHLPGPVRIVLVSLALSPVPPLLPRKERKSGGNVSFGLGLMAILALISVVAIPLTLAILQRIFGRQLEVAPMAIMNVVLKSTLLPLLAGVAVRAALPEVADRIMRPVKLIANLLMTASVLVLLAATAPAIWASIGGGAVLAMVIFTVAGLTVGHILGAPDPEHSVVLALSTACRHPAIALTIATANFPDQQFGPMILLYILVSAIVGIPYLRWQQHQTGAPVRTA
jgi:bile acid:Na+ symporter, BASS family